MIFLAYAAFIILLALPFLVVAMIAGGVVGGGALTVSGLVNGQPRALITGLLLFVVSAAAAILVYHWAPTPPAADVGARSPHRVVFNTYRSLKARQQATRWMRDGTFERLDADVQRARAKRPPEPPAGETPPPPASNP